MCRGDLVDGFDATGDNDWREVVTLFACDPKASGSIVTGQQRHLRPEEARRLRRLRRLHYLRQTRSGIACGTPPSLAPYASSMGRFAGCEAAPDTMTSLIGNDRDEKRYVDLFTLPPSVDDIATDPTNDVIVVGIDAPTPGVQTILAIVGAGGGKQPSLTWAPLGPQCIVALQHSCQEQPSPAFFGVPSVRLDTVIGAAHLNQHADICGTACSRR